MIIKKQAKDPRNTPTKDFIEHMRQRFPVEAEVDVVLTQKMQNRINWNKPYTPVSLDELIKGLSTLLRDKLNTAFEVSNTRWLSGGASMLQMAFDLHWRGLEGDEPEPIVTPMVLRMSPMEPVSVTSFLREHEIVNLLYKHSDILIPRCYWIDDKGEFLTYPAIIYGFVNGVAKPSSIPSTQVTGIGLNFGPELRAKLAPQVIEQIADIHTFDINAHKLQYFDDIKVGSNEHAIKEVNWWHRVWEEDRGEDEPLIQVAANWLRRNAPILDHVSIVHNDMRSGNFLFDEDKAEITSWLDWELVSLGDRHQDLGWMTAYQFGHYAEDGKTYLASGLMPTDELLKAYEKATGLPIDPVRLQYYDIFNSWRAAIIVMGAGYRVASGGKSHQDVVVTWLNAIGYHILENLRTALKEALA